MWGAVSRNDHGRDLQTKGLPSCVYVMWSARAGQFKIGEGDVKQRLGGHRTVLPDMEVVGAVVHPSSGAIEGQLHAHFKNARVGLSEMFEPTPDLVAWTERFRSRPNVAATLEEIPGSYSTPDLWPWSENGHLEVDRQTALDITTPYVPVVGSGEGQTSAISEDWYTPARYVEAVRELFGGRIDLDPASCPEANRTVQAEDIYTAEVDGLRHRWYGNVYLNPPWGRTGRVKKAFVRKALQAYAEGEINSAVLALNSNAATSAWFAPLFANPICFPNHRVTHFGPGGAGGNPNSGTVFVYLGPEPERFAAIFSQFGSVVPPAYPSLYDNSALAEDWDDEEEDAA